ncbi:hypothetical protein EV182_000163 [Spiromyces aspiralis]|uniref:Uncharacterized protein n=1 Tax=Spiromyces aspiralis TaxID=68401 RepID=A0ACC1HJP0_9FUNG|nr:hypothetical protein EV182_000163 [Spiromyces aspiralis]
MITPKFAVTQDDDYIYITIHAPYIRAQGLEFLVDGDQFTFQVHPYYLRLTFPGDIEEDESCSSSYDVSKGDISVKLKKSQPGQHFPNLDLLSTLLATRSQRLEQQQGQGGRGARQPLIQEIITSDMKGKERPADIASSLGVNIEEIDWELPQTLNTDDDEQSSMLIGEAKYGFDQRYSGWFTHTKEMTVDINEVRPEPEKTTPADRRKMWNACLDSKFDEDYYMNNYVFDDDIISLIEFKTPYQAAFRQLRKHQQEQQPQGQAGLGELPGETSLGGGSGSKHLSDFLELTAHERDIIRNLPRKTYLVKNEQSVYLGLVDIIYAYMYQYRTNFGETNVESAWTIGSLSTSMAGLESNFMSLRNTIVANFKRALAYPLYRNWDLCQAVLRDTYVAFRLGRRALLKVLLHAKDVFDHHDIYYIYGKILLDDYCIWIQTTASDAVLRSLASHLHHLKVQKAEVGWHLEEFEDLALETTDDEEEEGEGEGDRTRTDEDGKATDDQVIIIDADGIRDLEHNLPELLKEMEVDQRQEQQRREQRKQTTDAERDHDRQQKDGGPAREFLE